MSPLVIAHAWPQPVPASVTPEIAAIGTGAVAHDTPQYCGPLSVPSPTSPSSFLPQQSSLLAAGLRTLPHARR